MGGTLDENTIQTRPQGDSGYVILADAMAYSNDWDAWRMVNHPTGGGRGQFWEAGPPPEYAARFFLDGSARGQKEPGNELLSMQHKWYYHNQNSYAIYFW